MSCLPMQGACFREAAMGGMAHWLGTWKSCQIASEMPDGGGGGNILVGAHTGKGFAAIRLLCGQVASMLCSVCAGADCRHC